ncbi:hypothetical protein GFS03_12535 [Sulfolobus sp. E5-1-F]|uniref:hypothetical protein n=1 Tax=Saccharolobus sp. E5-1-F TaxID=2663019 RepID=UPI001296958B|nr:hypothetical protein [Sulfolobus sp. E5-1-F]QGA55338.1 hypothetical protein GFS03_12535 [Sulfolobus sp. E5-1-F]
MEKMCKSISGTIDLPNNEWIFYILNRPSSIKESPLLIMFHGFTRNHIEAGRLFTDLVINLCNAGITTHRFDYRGHGDSYGFFDEAFSIKNALTDSEYIVN